MRGSGLHDLEAWHRKHQSTHVYIVSSTHRVLEISAIRTCYVVWNGVSNLQTPHPRPWETGSWAHPVKTPCSWGMLRVCSFMLRRTNEHLPHGCSEWRHPALADSKNFTRKDPEKWRCANPFKRKAYQEAPDRPPHPISCFDGRKLQIWLWFPWKNWNDLKFLLEWTRLWLHFRNAHLFRLVVLQPKQKEVATTVPLCIRQGLCYLQRPTGSPFVVLFLVHAHVRFASCDLAEQ